MTIHDRHIELVEAVNAAKTASEHDRAGECLRAWREGVRLGVPMSDAEYGWFLMDGDRHYINQGIDRPTCCGVWLDWEPTLEPSGGDR